MGPRPCALLLVAPLVFRAPEGPAAREARASLRSAPRLEARPCPPDPPAPSTPVGLGRCCLVRCVVSKPGQALPPSTGTAAGPSGALHTGGARLLMCVVSKPGQAPPPLSNFARNSPVTLSNIEFRSLELQRFQSLLKLCPIELRARFWGRGLVSAMARELVHCLPFRCCALPG